METDLEYALAQLRQGVESAYRGVIPLSYLLRAIDALEHAQAASRMPVGASEAVNE